MDNENFVLISYLTAIRVTHDNETSCFFADVGVSFFSCPASSFQGTDLRHGRHRNETPKITRIMRFGITY